MATNLEIIRGIGQAAANCYDGAVDDKGEPIKIGLQREVDNVVTDSRTMDGFKVKMIGNLLCVTYQCEMKIKDVHNKDFENNIAQAFKDYTKFLKKEYKNITGNALSLTEPSEIDTIVQSTSRVRTWCQSIQKFVVKGIEVSDNNRDGDPKIKSLDDAIKSWLSTGKDTYPRAKKPENVTRKKEG
tara:strand:+ start:585 stop:1139 length:555 start_codon:yes stop_codon:yes gene_type:complete